MYDASKDARIHGRIAGKPLLTIVTGVYDDYPGLAFTLANLTLNHADCMPMIEIVVVDNNPTSGHGMDCASLLNKIPNARYNVLTPYSGTMGVKNAAVLAAETEYVMWIDSHVFLKPGSLKKLLSFLSAIGSSNDLFQGPMIDQFGSIYATHMNPGLSGGNFGRWGTYRDDNRLPIDNCDLYEIPMHGMGLFIVRRDAWPGFHPAMWQFGSEEGYIHEKYRLLGRKCYSLPFMKWWHLFRNASVNIPYPFTGEHKYRNQLIGWTEVGLPVDVIDQYWSSRMTDKKLASRIKAEVDSLEIKPLPRPADYQPLLGYPIRVLDGPGMQSESFVEYEQVNYIQR